MGELYLCVSAGIGRFRCWFSSVLQPKPFLLAIPLLLTSAVSTAQGKIATTTVLAVTANAAATSSVPVGTVLTLTATVTPASGKIGAGQVNFCDATAKYCADIHLLGTAQLTSAGTAALKFRPGLGSHSYKAMFIGTQSNAPSTSGASSLTVTGKFQSTTTIAQSGIAGDYTLTATVTGLPTKAKSVAPVGTVSFLDTSYADQKLGTANVGTGTSGLSFLNSSNPATVTEPNVVAAADFNNDGILDLAVSNSNSGATALTILLGNGDGTFTAVPTSPTVGLYPDGITAGDFNNDGIPDLAVTSVDEDEVVILLGKGDGTFNAGPILSTPSVPQSIAATDFNGDGYLDIAVVNGSTLSVFLGNGDGTFNAVINTPSVGSSPVGLGVGDFNGDGVPDVAIVDTLQNAPVRIFLGKGDGTFVAGSSYPLTNAAGPVGIAVGDFNGDGFPDLAVTNYAGPDQNAVAVLLGNGDGSFKTPVFYSAPGFSFESAAVADLDGDGIADLVLSQFWSGGPASILLGNGDGTFQAGKTVVANVPLSSGYLAVADFNGDGLPDIALPNQEVSGTVAILLTQNTQTVTAALDNLAVNGPGLHNVEASYPGDNNYLGSTSATTALQAKVADPVMSVPGGTYTSPQTLTITDATPGATIYYSEFGQISTNGFVVYTGPIPLSGSGFEDFQVYATEDGYLQSNDVGANYNLIFPPTETPTISLAPGFYSGPQTVTITDADSAAKIYYTTNGTYPGTASNLYSGPVTVSSSETLVARALSAGHSYSLAASAQYVIGGTSSAMIYTVAGSGLFGYTGDGGPATLAQIDYPVSIVKDASGNLYFSDIQNHMVRKVATGTGIISVVAGNGFYGYSGDGGQATSASLGYPASVALDKSGNLFIADTGNATVRKVNLASGVITTIAGNPTATSSGDGGPATAAFLGIVGGLAFDSQQNLYISDYATIRQVNASTGIINTIAGSGTYGYSGDGGPAISAYFLDITGLSFDAAGNLFLADTGNSIIRKIAATNGVISTSSIVSTVAGTIPQNGVRSGYTGDGGPATSATLSNPTSIALDSSGNLFISDTANSVIRKVTTSNGVINTVAGNNTCASLGGDGGAATDMSICFPAGIAVDSGGNLFIADRFNRIREVLPVAAPPNAQAAAPTFSLASGNYGGPQSVTISDTTPGASIYVTVDGTMPTTGSAFGYSLPINVTGALTIKAIATAPGYLTSPTATATYTVTTFSPVITTVAGSGVQGFYGAGGPALDAIFSSPRGVALDKNGNLYLSDSTNAVVWRISATTGTASIFAGTGIPGYLGDGGPAASAMLDYPEGLAFDGAGNLYIADTSNDVIRKVTASTGVISTVAGQQSLIDGNLGDGGPATSASLINPAAIAFDGAGNLYIADTGDYRIREVSATTGIIATVAGNGTYVFSGDGGPATSAGLQSPDSLAVDQAGNIYLASSAGSRVRKIASATGQINSIAGVKDLQGDSGDGGPATSAEIAPFSLALDPAGNLYVSSRGDIREINLNTGVISKVAGIGYPGYSGDGGSAADAEIFYPYQVAFDGAGNLYYADGLARVRRVNFTEQTTATPVFSPPAGTYTSAQNVTITAATPGSSVYYTTDGSTPTTSSTLYTTAIPVGSSETINAIAVAPDYNPSAVASATYVVNVSLPPTPSISSLSPAYTSAGGTQFTLTVSGSNFTNASTVYWGKTALTTQFISTTQLTAPVAANSIATAGIDSITVQTPSPGGGTSNALQFEVDTAGSTTPPSLSPSSVSVSSGGNASVSVTLPSSATNVSAQCLNLPPGATCTYSASTSALTITTTTSTPSGTYVITVVFTETLPGAAAAILLLPFLISFPAKGRRKSAKQIWLLATAALLAALAVEVGCGSGGSGGGGTNPPPQTHQVTSSGAISLTVK